MSDHRRDGVRNSLLALGTIAMVTGAALAAPVLWSAVRAGVTETSLVAAPPPATPAGSPGALAPPSPSPPADGPVDGVAFDIAIPSIGYRATVREGVEAANLDHGPGHYPTTAWPGRAGNVGVAGHNTFWIEFGRLKPGDTVTITTRVATYVYAITGSAVVLPDDRAVLAPSSDHRLTLTTCYPLWAGAFANRRLVLSAVEVGAVAASDLQPAPVSAASGCAWCLLPGP